MWDGELHSDGGCLCVNIHHGRHIAGSVHSYCVPSEASYDHEDGNLCHSCDMGHRIGNVAAICNLRQGGDG